MHNPLDMLVFAKVVELRSFSLTARRLGISRSAASKHVTRLEQALGARLLNRTTRKLSLTEPGHAAYAHCARIAAEVEASELSVQRFVSRPKGLLRVSAPSAFGRLHLVPILPEYLTRHPDVAIDLVLSDRLVDLVEERFDIAIQSSPLTPANLIRRDIAPIRWAVCAAPGYLQKVAAPRVPDDLRTHNCIFTPPPPCAAMPGRSRARGRRRASPSTEISAPTTARPCAMPRCAGSVWRCCPHSPCGRT
jgi:DNA-binding transcriptional LysR family regulator